MARSSISIYSPDPETLSLLKRITKADGLAVRSRDIGLEGAIKDAADWVIPPDILMIDMTGVPDIPAGIDQLADALPDAEVYTIVIGDQDNIRLVRKLREMGVGDYLLHPLVEDEIDAVLTAARSETDHDRLAVDKARIWTVTGSEGGTGVSTVAAAVASRLTKDEKARVLLLDCDLVSGVQYILHGGDKTPKFLAAIQQPGNIDGSTLERLVQRTGNSQLFLLSEPGELAEPPDEAGVYRFLAECTRAFDHIVLDLPRHATWARSAYRQSGRLIYMTRPTLSGGHHLLNFLEEHGDNLVDDALVVLSNDTTRLGRQALSASKLEEVANAPVFDLPHDPLRLNQEITREEEMILASGKWSKALAEIEDVLLTSAIGSGKKQDEEAKDAGFFGGIAAWLKA